MIPAMANQTLTEENTKHIPVDMSTSYHNEDPIKTHDSKYSNSGDFIQVVDQTFQSKQSRKRSLSGTFKKLSIEETSTGINLSNVAEMNGIVSELSAFVFNHQKAPFSATVDMGDTYGSFTQQVSEHRTDTTRSKKSKVIPKHKRNLSQLEWKNASIFEAKIR